MRVALCLHGVVGHAYTNKAAHEWHDDVDYRIGLEHYRRNLFASNGGVDVFMHCWSTDYEENLVRDYRPKGHRFERQIQFGHETVALNFLESRWYSTHEAVRLKRTYERAMGFEYDWVVLSRFDLALLRSLDLRQSDPSDFWAGQHVLLPHAADDPVPADNVNNGFCDMIFYSGSKNINRFSELHRKWREYGLFHAHAEAYAHTQACGFRVRHGLTKGEDFELVRYIYRDCHFKRQAYLGADALQRR